MSRLLIISLCAVVFVAACSTEVPDVTTEEEVDTIEVEQDVMEEQSEEDSEMEEANMEEESEMEGEISEAQAAQYVTYSEGAISEYEGSDKVIFFHASWCSTCRSLDSELSSNVSELPEGTVVMKADYDSETDLRQKYGVNAQHTMVFVDDEGNTTRSNLIGGDLANLKAEL